MNRPTFQAPPPPELPVPQAGTEAAQQSTVGDRLRLWLALAALSLAGWQVPVLAAALLTWWPADGGWIIAWEAAGLAGVLVVGVLYLVQPIRAELENIRRRAYWDDLQAEAYERGQRQLRRSRHAWDRRWSTQPAGTTNAARPVPVITTWRNTTIDDRPAARASATERPTQPLPELLAGSPTAPPRPAYDGSNAQVVIHAILAGQQPSSRRPPAGMTTPTFEATIAELVAAGVLIKRRGLPLDLAPGISRQQAFADFRVRKLLDPSPTAPGVQAEG